MNQNGSPDSRPSLLFWFSAGLASLVLRVGISSLILWRHGHNQGMGAWQGLWHDQPWLLAQGVRQLGLPWPELIAGAAVVAGIGSCLLWLIGLLTRVASIAMLFVLVGFAAYFRLAEDLAKVELISAYGIVALSLFILGGGPISLDILFRRRKGKSTQPPRRTMITPAPSHGHGWLQ